MSEVRQLSRTNTVSDTASDRNTDAGSLRLTPADYQAGREVAGNAQAASASERLVSENTLPSLSLTDDHSAGDTSTRSSSEHTVKSGESLWRIAKEALKTSGGEGHVPSDREIQLLVGAIARENHLSNPDLIHPGDVLKMPGGDNSARAATAIPETTGAGERTAQTSGDTTAQASSDTAARASDDTTARASGAHMTAEGHEVSAEFARRTQANFASLPKPVRDLLVQSGNKIVAAGKMSNLDASVASTVIEQQSGTYDAGHKSMIVAETHKDAATGEYVRDSNSTYTFRRVAGRAVDTALGNVSASDSFKQAFEADFAAMSPERRARYAGLADGSENARAQVFAELFATTNGDAHNTDEGLAVFRDFANSKRAMQASLAQLE